MSSQMYIPRSSRMHAYLAARDWDKVCTAFFRFRRQATWEPRAADPCLNEFWVILGPTYKFKIGDLIPPYVEAGKINMYAAIMNCPQVMQFLECRSSFFVGLRTPVIGEVVQRKVHKIKNFIDILWLPIF